MKYIILGLGKSGKATLKWCQKNFASAIVIDDSLESALEWVRAESVCCDVYSSEIFLASNCVIDSSDICILSPGIPKKHQVYSFLQDKIPIISEVELALRTLKGRFPQMIAVTGTNGKTTVVTLLTHVLNTCGIRAQAIGNIGTPVIEALTQEEPFPERFVVELSSFQLEHIFSPAFSIGCWLNIAPNHLDWHSSMDEYVQAKGKLPSLMQRQGIFFLHESISYPMPSSLKVIPYGRNTDSVEGLGIEATHDLDNFLVVAKIAGTFGIGLEAVKEAYKTFKKPRFRLERVGHIDGITYINDSKSTNIASTEAALEACEAQLVLIAGGVHKGASYSSWKRFAGKVISIVAIGQAKNLIKDDVGETIPVVFASSLQEAVSLASRICDFSGTVLLSPGCSSFDMFTDYVDRGRQFSEIVREREKKKVYD